MDKLASLQEIHLRTGCFCNTGACQQYLHLTNEQIKSNLSAGHVCGDDVDLIDGQPTGSVRISFGYMSDFEDAQRFLRFVQETFLEKCSTCPDEERSSLSGQVKIEEMCANNNKQSIEEICTNSKEGIGAETVSSHSFLNCNNDDLVSKANSVVQNSNVVSRSEIEHDDVVGLHQISLEKSEIWEAEKRGEWKSHKIENERKESKTVFKEAERNEATASFASHPKPSLLERICLYPIKSCAAFEVNTHISVTSKLVDHLLLTFSLVSYVMT